MDRQRLSSIAHQHHPIWAPVSGVTVNRILRRAGREPHARVLDLGCGEAAWSMQALAHHPDGHADAIDISRHALDRAAAMAAARGLDDRLTLHERDARSYPPDGDYDLVLCIGSTHAFGGFGETVHLAGRHVHPDGVLVVGECFWEVPPTPAALAALEVKAGDYRDLPDLVDEAERGRLGPGVRPCQRRRRVGRLRVVVDRVAHRVGTGQSGPPGRRRSARRRPGTSCQVAAGVPRGARFRDAGATPGLTSFSR